MLLLMRPVDVSVRPGLLGSSDDSGVMAGKLQCTVHLHDFVAGSKSQLHTSYCPRGASESKQPSRYASDTPTQPIITRVPHISICQNVKTVTSGEPSRCPQKRDPRRMTPRDSW